MAEPRDAIRQQAITAVEQTFTRQRDDQARGHAHELRAHGQARCQEIVSFMKNRDTAISRHRGALQVIDNQERLAWQQVQKQQRSLSGRMSGLLRPGERERQNEAFLARFESLRLAEHRKLNSLQERQSQIEQSARIRYGKEDRALHQRFREEKHELSQWQTMRRDPMVQQQTRSIAEAQLRLGLRHEQQQTHQRSR